MGNYQENGYIDNILIPAMYEKLDLVFPDLQFVNKGEKWTSRLKKDGTNPKEQVKEKTIIKRDYPYAIIENGEEAESILKFAMRYFGKSYNDTIDLIAEIIGVQKPKNLDEAKLKEWIEHQEKLMSAVQEMQQALFSPEAKHVLSQLTEGRGYTYDEIKQMGLGYIDASLEKKYLSEKIFIPYGVGETHQIVIPYISEGKVEGLKFRKTNAESPKPKYLNSKGFRKSDYLFGLSAIKYGQTKNENTIILLDGELKALYMSIKGFENVVSSAGSDGKIISEEQLKRAKFKGVRHIVIIPDNESTEKERENEKNKIIETIKLINEHGICAYVVNLPQYDVNQKEDVEDFIRRHGVLELKRHIDNAIQGEAYRAQCIIDKYLKLQGDTEQLTAKQQNNLAAEFFSLINEYIKNPIATGTINDVWKNSISENFSDFSERVIEQAKKEAKKQRILSETDDLQKRLSDAVKANDVDEIKRLQKYFATIIEEDNASKFESCFAQRRFSDIEEKLKHRRQGIRTKYILQRGNKKDNADAITLPYGALSIIAAPTNHGKSTMLQNLAIDIARSSITGSVIYLTLEEDKESVISQFLSKLTGEPISRNNKRSIKSFYNKDCAEYFAKGKEQAFERARAEMREMVDSGRIIIEEAETDNGIQLDTISNLISYITEATKQLSDGVAAVFIDYIQLIRPDKRTTNRVEDLKLICTLLKNCAVRLNIPIILAAQFSREGSKSPYELEPESLGEGGDIERAAAVIVGLWNTAKKPRQNSKFQETNNKIWSEQGHPFEKIEFNANEPKIYLRLLKSRGETTGGEALLECDLNVGIIKPNNSAYEDAASGETDTLFKPDVLY